MIVRQNKKAGVTWKQREDGKYIVTAGDEVLVETAVDTLAKIIFYETVAERDPARDARRREQGHFDMQAVRSQPFERRAANARKKGGRGGV